MGGNCGTHFRPRSKEGVSALQAAGPLTLSYNLGSVLLPMKASYH